MKIVCIHCLLRILVELKSDLFEGDNEREQVVVDVCGSNVSIYIYPQPTTTTIITIKEPRG